MENSNFRGPSARSELFRKVAEQANEAIYVIDPPSGRFIEVNEAACRDLGYSRDELLKMEIQDIETQNLEDSGWNMQIGAIRTGASKQMSGTYRRKDGSTFPVEVNLKMIRDKGRDYLVAFARDASERKAAMEKLKESQEQLSTIMESIPLSITILDENNAVSYINLTTADWYGLPPHAVTGAPDHDIWKYKEERDRFMNSLDQIGYVEDFEAVHKGAGGVEQWALVSGVKIMLNGAPVKLITRRDVTLQKKTEESLKAAKTQAENATELKDKFVSIVSHDLRSPLSSIQGLLGLVKGHIASGKVDAKTLEIVNKVITAADMMVTMVDQLLDISRLQTGKIVPEKESFSVKNFIDDCVEAVDYLAEEKGIAIFNQVPAGMFISADRGLFAEVINNLLTNAVKFCREGDQITIFNPDKQAGVVAVKDTGVGMDAFTRENIFKHEVKTTTDGTAGEKGTGLGLPYCHDIMAAHGGSLTVESAPGQGSVFYARLP